MSESPEYRLDREFDAPCERVWRAWTEPELLQRWYGPGATTIVHRFDLRPGGEWLNEMQWGGNANYQRVVFLDVSPAEKLVWHHHSCTDANWNDVPNPMMADWPRVLLTTVSFEDLGEKTRVRLTQAPQDASDAEIACFAEAMANMDKGWGSGYAIIDELLAELRAKTA